MGLKIQALFESVWGQLIHLKSLIDTSIRVMYFLSDHWLLVVLTLNNLQGLLKYFLLFD